MKKILALLFVVFCLFQAMESSAAEKKPLRVLASVFPVYLFTQNICANIPDIEVDLLVPAQAGCPHDFALKPADLQKLAKADILIINGHDLEEFLDKILQNPQPGLKIINAGEGVAVLPAAVSSHGHEHGNPHIFAAPAEASQMVRNIGAALSAIDPSQSALYSESAEKFARELERLSAAFKGIGPKAPDKNVVIAHDGLAYIMKNSGLNVVAVLENSDSIAKLAALKKEFAKTRPALIAGDAQYSSRLPQTLARESGVPFAELNTCATGPQNPPLDFYQQVMEGNLKVLERFFE